MEETLHYSPRIRPDCVTLTKRTNTNNPRHISQLTVSRPMKKRLGRQSVLPPAYLTKDKTRPAFTYRAGLFGKFMCATCFLTRFLTRSFP